MVKNHPQNGRSRNRSSLCIFSDTQFKCVILYRRTEDIIEIQEGWTSMVPDNVCEKYNADVEKLAFTALIRECIKGEPIKNHARFQ